MRLLGALTCSIRNSEKDAVKEFELKDEVLIAKVGISDDVCARRCGRVVQSKNNGCLETILEKGTASQKSICTHMPLRSTAGASQDGPQISQKSADAASTPHYVDCQIVFVGGKAV